LAANIFFFFFNKKGFFEFFLIFSVFFGAIFNYLACFFIFSQFFSPFSRKKVKKNDMRDKGALYPS